MKGIGEQRAKLCDPVALADSIHASAIATDDFGEAILKETGVLELLDWAERAREAISVHFWGKNNTDGGWDYLLRLLEELPE